MMKNSNKQTHNKIKTLTKENHVGLLYPYKPHTDQGLKHQFSEYDVLWSTSLLCKPGKQGFFLVYKFDNDRVLKAHFSTNIPIRTSQNVHHHILQKIKQKESQQEIDARRDKNYYFDIFQNYSNQLAINSVLEVLKTDFTYWEVPYMQELHIVGQKGYQSLIKVMNKYAQPLIILYKRLQSSSETFPLLNYKCILDWAKQCSIVNDNYTAH